MKVPCSHSAAGHFFESALNYYPITVVDFVLDDLGGVAREVLDAVYEVFVQILHFNAAIASAGTLTDERKASFTRLAGIDLLKNLGVVHEQRLAAILYADDALAYADHVVSEAYALVLMFVQRVQKILPGRGIFGASVLGGQA